MSNGYNYINTQRRAHMYRIDFTVPVSLHDLNGHKVDRHVFLYRKHKTAPSYMQAFNVK